MTLEVLLYALINHLAENPDKKDLIVRRIEVTDKDNIRIHYKKEKNSHE